MTRPRRATLVATALVLGALAGLVAISLTNALVYYVTPTELVASPQSGTVRLYGVVQPGSVSFDAPSSTLTFRVADGTTAIVVTSRSLPAGMFRDGMAVVLAGRLTARGQFTADEILVKHSEVYEPLQPGETVPPGVLDTLPKRTP